MKDNKSMLAKRKLNHQLKFFGSGKRFISIYAKKPRIRINIYPESSFGLITHNPLSSGRVIKCRGSIL